MKKIRTRSKSGFTLLEVLLAVVILVIASTMIMKGFIAVMIFGRNDRNYAMSGEANYRRAMNETIIHYATAANQQTDVITPLTGGVHSTLTANFVPGYTPSGVSASDLNLTVDVSAYTNPDISYTQVIGGDDIDPTTSSVNRYAFFYDYGDFIGPTAMGDHIYRYGYMFASTAQYNAMDAATKAKYRPVYGVDGVTISGYGMYGFYCFNADHVHTSGSDTVPDACRCTPLTTFGT